MVLAIDRYLSPAARRLRASACWWSVWCAPSGFPPVPKGSGRFLSCFCSGDPNVAKQPVIELSESFALAAAGEPAANCTAYVAPFAGIELICKHVVSRGMVNLVKCGHVRPPFLMVESSRTCLHEKSRARASGPCRMERHASSSPRSDDGRSHPRTSPSKICEGILQLGETSGCSISQWPPANAAV